jgi:predicted nucleotidyltransferase component of viral defense system
VVGQESCLLEGVEEPKAKESETRVCRCSRIHSVVYSLNEILIEKIRSIFQRGKARDYYHVCRFMSEHKFDLRKIRRLLIEKCTATKVKFKPDCVFDETRLGEAEKFWTIALARLTKDLSDFDKVVSNLREKLGFLEE